MKFREPRGSFSESMKTVVEFNNVSDNFQKLIAHLEKVYDFYPPGFIAENLRIDGNYYHDERNGWDTHYVCLKDGGILGFTDNIL